MLRFIIGTQNSEKVASAKGVIGQMYKKTHFAVEGIDVPSGFGETPLD